MKHIKLLLMLTLAIGACFFMGHAMASAYSHPEYGTALSMVLLGTALIPKAQGVLAETASPDLSAIARYAYKNKFQLLKRYFNGMDIAKDITLYQNVKTAIPLPMLVINGQPRPYDGIFSSPGGVGYTDRELTVGDFQRDFKIEPALYRNTYLAQERGPGEGANNMKIPFAQFTTEAAIDDNTAQLNNRVAFFGLGKSAYEAFNPATAYTVGKNVKALDPNQVAHYFTCKVATNAGETPYTHPAKWVLTDALAITEGLGTKLIKSRATGLITNVVSTGAIDPTNAFQQALSVFRALPSEVKDSRKDIFLYVSSNTIDAISDSFKDDIKKYTDADGVLSILPRTEGICKLKKATWMSGSDLMIASPKSNLYMGTDLLSDTRDLKTIEQMYHLDMSLKGVLGFEFGDEQAIAMNDQN